MEDRFPLNGEGGFSSFPKLKMNQDFSEIVPSAKAFPLKEQRYCCGFWTPYLLVHITGRLLNHLDHQEKALSCPRG